MWITERAGLGGVVHHMPLIVRFDGRLDTDAMLAACAAVVARHPALTATFAERDGRLFVAYGTAEPPISVAPGYWDEDAAEPFDLAAGPPARFTLSRTAPAQHVLRIVAHHIVFDGVSKDVLLADLAAAYAGSPLPPLAPPPAGPLALDGAAGFWRGRWRDEAPLLPGGRPASQRAVPGEAIPLPLDGLPAAAARLGVTRFEALLTALTLALYGYGNQRPAVAVDLSTRTPETRDHVGYFVNEIPLFVTPSGTYGETAHAVRDELRASYRHRGVPVARALGGVSPRTALLPVTVSYRRRELPDPVFPGVTTAVDWAVFNGWVRGSLHLQVIDAPAGITAWLQFSPLVLTRAGADDVAGHLRALLGADPSTPIGALPLPARVEAVATGPVATGPVQDRPSGVADPEVIERVLAIWCEVLEIDDIQPEDDLFDVGGHSLSITQIIARVRERLGVELSFEVFIDAPTVLGIAEEIAREAAAC
jgi:acyl carrier protein